MIILSSLRRTTLFVKGFINFGFWFWRPLMLMRGLFFMEFYIIKFKKISYFRRKLNPLHYDKH